MHPRQVQQYIGRKLGEFYGLLLARRRSIALCLEENLNTTLRRSKNWRWEKHFFVVWYLTPFQILCLDSKKILAWCSNQLVATIIKLIWSYPGGGFFEFASSSFFWLNGKILLRRELRNNTNIFQNYIQKIQRSWAWAKKTKNAIQPRPVGQYMGSPVSNSRDPIKRDRSIIITVY